MKTKIILAALVMMLAVSINAGHTQGMDEFDGPGKGFPGIPELSADQMKQMQTLRLEHQKEVLPVRTQLQSRKLDLETLIMEEASQSKIDKKIEEIGTIQTQLMKMRVKHRVAVRYLLTEDQKIHFDSQNMDKKSRRGRDSCSQHPPIEHRGMRGDRSFHK